MPLKQLLISIVVFFVFSNLFAQSGESQSLYSYHVGIKTGTDALPGVDFILHDKKKNSLGIGFLFGNFQLNNLEYYHKANDISLQPDIKIALSAFQLRYDRKLYKNLISFSTGISIFNKNSIGLKVKSTETIDFNDIQLTPDEIGFVEGVLTWQTRVSPMIGLSIGSQNPAKKIWYSLNFGVYYKGAPSLQLNATNLFRSNEQNEDLIEQKLQFFKWLPYLNFAIYRRI